jgi:light-independent protochlorophyllide reductase subunit B
MFREDFEFHGDAAASHLSALAPSRERAEVPAAAPATATPSVEEQAALHADATASAGDEHEDEAFVLAAVASPVATVEGGAPAPPRWGPDAEKELGKIPFFVRGKARRNTEKYAQQHGIRDITVDVLYDAKAHFGR